ncbi:hypothetical protein QBC36DRAFT_245636 [Triangularia setosa]|uniref:Succinate dehydrogenase assembly factor 4, mitochondrial n=1 Tax=Triangularia setosa TaxID=2587417 RepID=A0AAN6W1G0_9PEZI|nr:hypothetical protein QBC36DRAFT_245636 [Podospora setosa]
MMNRLAGRTLLARVTPMPMRSSLPVITGLTPARLYGDVSSPKSAEKASAQSGGSRSKDAVEKDAAEKGDSSSGAGFVPDQLAQGGAKGRTGGGEPLESSHHPPAQPKISNASVPGNKPNLSKEQQAEVDAHNAEFDKKHGRAAKASDDKVNKSFWSGRGGRTVNGPSDD